MTTTTKGSASKLNYVKGFGGVISATDTEISSLNQPVVKGAPIYNTDTGRLVISDGVTPPAALPDHKHDGYSPVVHSHMYGANQPWFMANARLWYSDDIANHPELVALDGSEIADDKAEHLSTVFPGTKLLTKAVTTMTSAGFENDDLTLSVDNFVADWPASKLFGSCDFSDIGNMIANNTDQWLTSSTDVNATHTLTVKFKGNFKYRPGEYWVIPAAGTLEMPFKSRPTPNTWVFEGSDDGETWTTLDSHSGVTADDWPLFTIQTFTVDTTESYSQLRLKITAWNAGDDGTTAGLKRFYIFGRKQGVFCLPDVPSPIASFSWVVPYKNMDVGLVHEEVGDIGRTSLLPENLPSYRIPTDGSAITKTSKPLLYASIGHSCDHRVAPSAVTVSTGTYKSDSGWNTGLTDITTAAYMDLTLESGMCLGGYLLDCSTTSIPSRIVIEGVKSDGTYETLQTIEEITEDEFNACGGLFMLDSTTADGEYTKYRLNVVNWHPADTLGITKITVLVHPKDKFYVPDITDNTVDGVYNYIVADNTATDVTPNIIQRLQQNIVDLTSAIASMQNQLNNLDSSITK